MFNEGNPTQIDDRMYFYKLFSKRYFSVVLQYNYYPMKDKALILQ